MHMPCLVESFSESGRDAYDLTLLYLGMVMMVETSVLETQWSAADALWDLENVGGDGGHLG